MLSVVCYVPDGLYQYGFINYLQDILWKEFKRNISVNVECSMNNLENADIVILYLQQGEETTCFPELFRRNIGGMIGIVDAEPPLMTSLPDCLENIAFISKKASLNQVREKIIFTIDNFMPEGIEPSNKSCMLCNYAKLSKKTNGYIKCCS